MSNSDDNYVGVLLEQIRDEIKAVHEEVGGMREELANVPKREEFNELKDDMKVVKAGHVRTLKDILAEQRASAETPK